MARRCAESFVVAPLLIGIVLASSARDLVDFGTSYTYPVRLQGLDVPVSSGGWRNDYRSKLRKPLLADSGASLADIQQLAQTGSSDEGLLIRDGGSGARAQDLAPIAYGESEPIIAPTPPNQGEVVYDAPRRSSQKRLNPVSYQPSRINPGAAYADLVASPVSVLKPVDMVLPSASEKLRDVSQAYKYKLGYGFAQKTKYGLQGLGSIMNRGYGSTSGTEAGYDTAAEKLPLNSYLSG